MKKMIAILLLWAAFSGIAVAQQMEVSPNPAEVMPGGTVQFSVPGQEQSAIFWQALPPSLGAIDEKGRFTAGNSAGQGIVRATIRNGDKRLLGHALIRIVGSQTQGLTVKVSPGSARLEPGSTETFSAGVSYLNGDPAAAAVISWKVLPSGLGTIDQGGNFTALNPGTGRIVALAKSDESKGIGQAKITVGSKLKPQKLIVAMTPVKANLKPGDNAVFSVTVNDRNGNPVAAKLEFLVEPTDLGNIDGSGNFTAGEKTKVGTVRVLAKSETGSGAARSLVVVGETIQRYTVKIKPRQSALLAGQSLEFTAEAFDHSGNPVTPPYWTWKLIPEKLGEVSPRGVFTAGQKAGQGKVVASLPPQFGLGQAAASIRIKPGQPLRIKINPPAAQLLPGQLQQFTATVFNAQGQPMPLAKIFWKIYPEGLGTINQNGLFQAGSQPGKKGAVIAILPPQQGGGQGAAGISISDYKIRIDQKPGPVNLTSGEIHNFSATITDANGNTVTTGQLEWLTEPSSPAFGTINQAGVFTAGNPSGQVAGWVIVRATISGGLIGDRIAVIVKSR
jgi:hypothetical protein